MASMAVVGSGAIGLFYGAQFALAGLDLRFLLRRDHARISADGIRIDTTPTPEIARARDGASLHLSPGAFHACLAPAECARGGAPDWVLLALKTTALPAARALLDPMLGASTRIVAMCNGLGVEEALASWCDPERVFGAVAHVCVRRRADGSIHHQAHGKVLVGHFRDRPERVAELTGLLDLAGIAHHGVACLLEARWRKLVWNFPYNGLSVALGEQGSSTEEIMRDPASRALLEELMREVVAVANADLSAAGSAAHIGDDWVREMIARTESMGPYLTSTLLDWRAGEPMETEAMFAEPVRRAKVLGVRTPRMEEVLERVREREKAGKGKTEDRR